MNFSEDQEKKKRRTRKVSSCFLTLVLYFSLDLQQIAVTTKKGDGVIK